MDDFGGWEAWKLGPETTKKQAEDRRSGSLGLRKKAQIPSPVRVNPDACTNTFTLFSYKAPASHGMYSARRLTVVPPPLQYLETRCSLMHERCRVAR